MQTFSIANLRVTAVRSSTDRICYVLFPLDGFGQWIEQAAARFGVSIVAISGMDWDDDLMPGPPKVSRPAVPTSEARLRNFSLRSSAVCCPKPSVGST